MPQKLKSHAVRLCLILKRPPRGVGNNSPANFNWTQQRSSLITLTVALALPLLRVGRAFGAEDEAGYRKSYYQEDDNRIHVSTDTWRFDVGLKDHVRVSGEVVVDAISGATPNGAPPQTKWPFPTYNNFYQQAYQSAYANLYGQVVNDPNNQLLLNAGTISFQELTNAAAGFAQQTAPGIVILLAAFHNW